MIHIYTDGSYNETTDTVGFGFVIVSSEGRVIRRGLGTWHNWTESRNVTGECVAALQAISTLHDLGYFDEPITIHHDYEGVAKWINGEWQAKKELTRWYVGRFITDCNAFHYHYRFEHVTAHSGDEWNEEADRLAKGACEL